MISSEINYFIFIPTIATNNLLYLIFPDNHMKEAWFENTVCNVNSSNSHEIEKITQIKIKNIEKIYKMKYNIFINFYHTIP